MHEKSDVYSMKRTSKELENPFRRCDASMDAVTRRGEYRGPPTRRLPRSAWKSIARKTLLLDGCMEKRRLLNEEDVGHDVARIFHPSRKQRVELRKL
jgi:hypothetical protein